MTHEPDKPILPPLIPSSSKNAATVGGIGAAILAALGWLASQFIALETDITRATDRIELGQGNINRALDQLDEDVDELQQRMVVIEKVQTDRIELERRRNPVP